MKVFFIILFPLIMTALSLFYVFSIAISNLGDISAGYMDWIGFLAALGVFSIPFVGFTVITCLCLLNKLNMFFANILTVIWIIVCLPLTWFIAIIIDRHVYLGVELYL